MILFLSQSIESMPRSLRVRRTLIRTCRVSAALLVRLPPQTAVHHGEPHGVLVPSVGRVRARAPQVVEEVDSVTVAERRQGIGWPGRVCGTCTGPGASFPTA